MNQGKLSQVQIYRASLGLDPLSEFDLCRLHREEMDDEDNTVCTKYDPKNQRTFLNAPKYTATAIVALVVSALSIIFTIGTTIGILYPSKKGTQRKSAQIEFLLLLLLGLFLVSLGSLLLALEPSEGSCISSMWMINVGYTTQLVPTIMRVSTIIKIVQASKKMRIVKVDKKKLFTKSVGISAIAALYCALWTGLDPPSPRVSMHANLEGNTVTVANYCDSESSIWLVLSLILQGCLLVCATVLAYQMRSVPNSVNDSRELAVLIYSSFIFLILRFAVYLISFAGDSLGKDQLQSARSLFCSVDTIANILIFFPRIFRPEDDKKGGISGLTNPITGSHKASVGRKGTMETSDVSHKAINKHSVPGQVQDVRGGHKLSTQISDLPTDQTDGHHVEKLRKSGVDEISAEEEKDEEDSSTVRFRMKDQLIVLPKWVLEEYGTMESIDLCEGEPVTKAEGMPSEV